MIVKVRANSDHANITWRPSDDKPIPNCLGFAIYRRPAGSKSDGSPLETFVGPQDGPRVPDGARMPSTKWPIQKFMWSDYDTHEWQSVEYRVIPMCGTSFDDMAPLEDAASDWTAPVELMTRGESIIPYFNRGIVATQWVARKLAAHKGRSLKSLVDPAAGTNDVRDFLGGRLKRALLTTLAEREKEGCHIFASLFELNDPEVIPALAAFGHRAHIILSNGTHSQPKQKPGTPARSPNTRSGAAQRRRDGSRPKPFDENQEARAALRESNVELHDRMVSGNHFSHHKFIVFCDAKDPTRATSVWTGSTNLTYGGLCTQANNAILINSQKVAERFLAQWRELVKSINDYPPELLELDANAASAAVGAAKVTTWFSPNPAVGAKPKTRRANGDHGDLRQARSIIKNAKEGVLFLVFNPGFQGTLLNDILDLADSPEGQKLYIHGVANQNPTGGKNHTPLLFVHRNKLERAPAEIVLPAAVNPYPGLAQGKKKDLEAAKAMTHWLKLVDNYWKQEQTGLGMVRVHSKCIVVDPFGKSPGVITGSHNLGPKASALNDDNMVIIEHNSTVAEQFAVNIITIYNQYRWRFQQLRAAQQHQRLNEWHGLQAPWMSQDRYLTGASLRELEFWT